jgi:hypothetical protein
VLTWLALRYTKHDRLDNLSSYLAVYDEVDRRESKGIDTGGINKGNEFFSRVFPKFTSDPLNRLLTQVRETFSFRYQIKQHSPGEIQQAMDFMASMASGRPVDPSKAHLVGAYFYASGMESLKKPNWLIEVFNKHLESDDWPLDDKAVANDITAGTSSSLKRKSDQIILVERPLGSNTKRRL